MLLSKNEDKTFEEVITQLCMYERNFRKIAEGATGEALFVKSGKPKQRRCTPRSKENDTCNYCKKKEHWISTCKKWIADGRPSKNEPQSNAVDTNVALSIDNEDIFQVETSLTGWWIDNGATKHVTNSPYQFVEFEVFKTSCTIKAAGNETLQAIGKGTIEILSFVEDKTMKMILKDVWYVPKISKNLFSVLAAQDRNEKSRFHSTATKCWLEVNGRTVLYGSRKKGGTLYKVAVEAKIPDKVEGVNIVEADNSILQLYHERWGHQDKRHVKDMLNRELGIIVKLVKDICEPCIFGKAHRLPFGTRKKVKKPGELFSTDVVGPFCESFSKKRFLVIFKDSYTKFRYGFVIKQKSDVKIVFKQFLAYAKTLGHNIKEIFSDNGGEFDCEEAKIILADSGITQRLTSPYTPEKNGGSERENRTTIEMARTFKYSNDEVEFPDAIWAELVMSAIYILNRTGKSSKEGISHYELWMGKKPRIKHLRIIGSSGIVHILAEKRKKMDKKAVKGYDGDERYRVYIPTNHKVIQSRDVQFLEKLKECESKVQLPLKDIESKNQGQMEEKYGETQIEDEDKYKESSIDREKKFKINVEENNQQTFGRILRYRSTLKKPIYFENYAMILDEFVNTVTEDPETFEDALKSENSVEWIVKLPH